MQLIVDDTVIPCLLTIKNGSKTLLRKKGRMKKLLRYVMEGTKKKNVQEAILELEPVLKFMVDSRTVIDIKE